MRTSAGGAGSGGTNEGQPARLYRSSKVHAQMSGVPVTPDLSFMVR